MVFFLSMAVFAFQSLLSPTLSTVFAGASLHLILAPAWLAFALAFLLWSLLPEKRRQQLSLSSGLFCLSTFLTAAALPLSFFLIKHNQESLNQLLQVQAPLQQGTSIENLLATSYNNFLLPMTFCASLPFFFYGLFLSVILQTLPRKKLRIFLVTELGGLMLGMVTAAAILDFTGQWGMAACFCLGAGLVGTLFALQGLQKARQPLRSLVLLLAAAGFYYLPGFEPEMSLNLSAHDFHFHKQVTEEHRDWTSFAKVQTLTIQGADKSRQVIALGNGTGTARLDPIDQTLSSTPNLATVQISLAMQPQKILILFAGAGAEIPSFEKYSAKPLQITGVEINPAVLSQALSNPRYGLGPYLQKHQEVSLLNMDARLFLQKTREHYDLILFSWAGATVAHYSGAVMHTTQYVLTQESLEQAYLHLNDQGALVIMPGSKMNILNSLKALEQKGEMSSLAEDVALIAFNDRPEWKKNWDDNVLIVKKGALTSENLQHLQEAAHNLQGELVLSPAKTSDEFQWHQKMLQSLNPQEVREALQQQYQLYFDNFTDDRPFVYHTTQSLFASSWSSWWQRLKSWRLQSALHDRVDFIVGLALLSLILLLFFLLLLLGPSQQQRGSQVCLYLASFAVGLSTVGLQLVVTYRSLLFLGNPTYALIFSTMIWLGGSTLAAGQFDRLEKRKSLLALTLIAGVLILGAFLFATQNAAFKQALFSMPLPLSLFVLSLILLPASIALGLLFPAILSQAFTHHQDHQEALHRLTAMDGVATALTVILTPLLVEEWGLLKVGGCLLGIFVIALVFYFQARFLTVKAST